ncbi:MAG: ABC transporter substrate-binding protein [Pararhodobacter sp.]|nr:ABC transporter substrate-binding protein [Pararhodobacter sp.]
MRLRRLTATTAAALMLSGTAALAVDEITVAYFLEWPTPNQFAQAEELYDEALGVRVNWRAFETGVQMSAAMAGGAVQIAFSQGVPPFVVASSAGLDIELVGVAVTYDDNDNCVVHESEGITAENALELEGKRVAVPLGTAAHYGMLRQMEHFGVDTTTMSIVDLSPADGAAAISRGDVAMACGWGGGLRRMLDYGNVLLTGAEKRALGIRIFDVVSVESNFAAENPELVARFLRVTDDMNSRFATDREAMLPVIADAAGMDMDGTVATIDGFGFPLIEEQLGAEWMGGGLQEFIKTVADFFVAQGTIDSALDSYEGVVNISYMEAAADM